MIRPMICEWDAEIEREIAKDLAVTGLEDHRVMVFDGSVYLRMMAYWCRNTPGESPHHQSESKEYPGWYSYNTVMFSQSKNYSEEDFESIKRIAQETIINPSHMFRKSKTFGNPSEISLAQREHVAKMVLNLNLEIPDVPNWLFPIPVAAIGEVPQHCAGAYGSFLCPLSDDLAVEVDLSWWLAHRDATDEEIEILEEQLK